MSDLYVDAMVEEELIKLYASNEDKANFIANGLKPYIEALLIRAENEGVKLGSVSAIIRTNYPDRERP